VTSLSTIWSEGAAFLQLTSLHNIGVRVKSLKQLIDS